MSKVNKCGLFIDINNPYLGASPDGLVGEDGMVEVKCLHSVQEEDLPEAVKDKQKGLCLEKSKNGKLQLKKTHYYYFQVQGQLNLWKRQWCAFVVFTK